jgi:outer membrane protein TolC
MSLPILFAAAMVPGLATGPATPSHPTHPSTITAAGTRTRQPVDTLHLAVLQRLAVARDPRADRRSIEREASDLRYDNLGVDRLPRFLVRGDAVYQSEVISLATAGAGFAAPVPPKDRYEVALEADWTLWDGGLVRTRRAVEEARLDNTLAVVDAEIFGTRADVTDAFFSALLLQEQVREVDALVDDLEARIEEMRARVDQGVALAGDMASMAAERLRAIQQRDALSSERTVALGTLSRLVGRSVDADEVLALPDLTAELEARPMAAVSSDTLSALPPDMRIHPRFAAFDAQRISADRQADAIRVTTRPSISAFGQLAYGSPGYDQFNDTLHEYWRAGLRVQWAPWNWNRRARQVEEIRVLKRGIEPRERQFSEELLRMLERPIRTMEYMRTAIESDDDIIELREAAEAHARAQFEERAISVAAYTAAVTALQEARIARLRHRTELARAQAYYLITLGVELP